MSDTVTTYTCQADNCKRTGTNKSDFKKVEYRDAISFAFVMCNKHAEQLIWSQEMSHRMARRPVMPSREPVQHGQECSTTTHSAAIEKLEQEYEEASHA